jgi:hypothetical protein
MGALAKSLVPFITEKAFDYGKDNLLLVSSRLFFQKRKRGLGKEI